MPTSAVYIRVSSKAQSFDMQADALLRALARGEAMSIDPARTAEHLGQVLEGLGVALYAEKASSKTNDRPELVRLLADVRAGVLDHLWVFKLDRLCRTGVADTFKIVSELRAAGVTLHAVADNLTIKPGTVTDVVSDTFVFALSLGAHLERAAINDRIAAARTRMDAAGEPWGRPPRMTAAERETALRMRGEKKSVRQIAQALGIPHATVGRFLAPV